MDDSVHIFKIALGGNCNPTFIESTISTIEKQIIGLEKNKMALIN